MTTAAVVLLFAVTVTTTDTDGVLHCQTYSDTYTDPAVARADAQHRVDRNEWAVYAHVRLIVGDAHDPDAATVRHETVWPTTTA